jgi:glycosyltransferase involved in cell wall biosynthesis
MACGVPPVATRTGGVPELVTDGVNGFLESVGDVAAQAARVVALLTDDRLHERLSQAARETALREFASSQVIPMYEQYYEAVCSR